MRSHAVPRRMLDVAGASLESILRSQMRGELSRISEQARRAGAEFGYTAVPDDFLTASSSFGLTPKALRQFFEEGVRFGSGHRAWRTETPGYETGGQPPPRTGTHLSVNRDHSATEAQH